jgi:hypothetical protein
MGLKDQKFLFNRAPVTQLRADLRQFLIDRLQRLSFLRIVLQPTDKIIEFRKI